MIISNFIERLEYRRIQFQAQTALNRILISYVEIHSSLPVNKKKYRSQISKSLQSGICLGHCVLDLVIRAIKLSNSKQTMEMEESWHFLAR